MGRAVMKNETVDNLEFLNDSSRKYREAEEERYRKLGLKPYYYNSRKSIVRRIEGHFMTWDGTKEEAQEFIDSYSFYWSLHPYGKKKVELVEGALKSQFRDDKDELVNVYEPSYIVVRDDDHLKPEYQEYFRIYVGESVCFLDGEILVVGPNMRQQAQEHDYLLGLSE